MWPSSVVLKDKIMTVFVEVEDNEVVTFTVVLKDKIVTVFVEVEDVIPKSCNLL